MQTALSENKSFRSCRNKAAGESRFLSQNHMQIFVFSANNAVFLRMLLNAAAENLQKTAISTRFSAFHPLTQLRNRAIISSR